MEKNIRDIFIKRQNRICSDALPIGFICHSDEEVEVLDDSGVIIRKCGDSEKNTSVDILRHSEDCIVIINGEKYHQHGELAHYDPDNHTLTTRKTFTLPDDATIAIIDVENLLAVLRDGNKERLYSFKQNEVISPSFSHLTPIKNGDGTVYRFDDKIAISGDSTTISGFISPTGRMYDGVYDNYFNREIPYDLNSHPNFMQYKALKRVVARDFIGSLEQKREHEKRKERFCANARRELLDKK